MLAFKEKPIPILLYLLLQYCRTANLYLYGINNKVLWTAQDIKSDTENARELPSLHIHMHASDRIRTYNTHTRQGTTSCRISSRSGDHLSHRKTPARRWGSLISRSTSSSRRAVVGVCGVSGLECQTLLIGPTEGIDRALGLGLNMEGIGCCV